MTEPVEDVRRTPPGVGGGPVAAHRVLSIAQVHQGDGLVNPLPGEHPRFRAGLDAVGFGVLIPVFYVTAGVSLDLEGLLNDPTALLRVPVLLLALLVARGVPALLHARSVGTWPAVGAGLLQATSLPFIVTASQVGVELDLMTPVTAAALVTAGALSVALFPTAAFVLLRRSNRPNAPRSGGVITLSAPWKRPDHSGALHPAAEFYRVVTRTPWRG